VGAPFNATVAIAETYVHGGRQGRASSRTTQMFYNGASSESFTQSWSWNALGDLGSVSYPQCTFAACLPVARTVSPGYTNGFLTSVPGWASSISYHANGMVNQITHSNGVVDTQANDPDMMRRPSALSSAKNGAPLWSSGTYKYDGSGNVIKTGNGYFLYDRVSRLIEGRVYVGTQGDGAQNWQSYTYDPFGNNQSIGGTSGRTTPTSSSTNRLNGAGTVYDSAGNLTNWNANVYEYDRFNQMTKMLAGTEDWRYIYTAGDERFWSYRVGGGGSLWALRDLDGRLLREYEAHTNWSTFKDFPALGHRRICALQSWIHRVKPPRQRRAMPCVHIVQIIPRSRQTPEVPLVPGELHLLGILVEHRGLFAEGVIDVVGERRPTAFREVARDVDDQVGAAGGLVVEEG
jgi:hypothetical protein